MVELKDVNNPVNHRTQMGHSRRAKMRQHLLISSLDLYADQPDAELMIDDLIGRDVSCLNYTNIMIAAEILCISPKSKLF